MRAVKAGGLQLGRGPAAKGLDLRRHAARPAARLELAWRTQV
jgi:hypothetical protein